MALEKVLSKSKLSQYLRSQCDRQLYLSLFGNKPDELKAAGLPIPLKTRPNVQVVTKSGKSFELEQYDNLNRAIPENIIFGKGYGQIRLNLALDQVDKAQTFLIQPIFQPETFRNTALKNLGLSAAEINLIPTLSGLIPDVVFVHEPDSDTFEILPMVDESELN